MDFGARSFEATKSEPAGREFFLADFRRFFCASVLVGALFTFFPNFHYLIEINKNFGLHYFLLCLAVCILELWQKHYWQAILAAGLVTSFGLVLLPFYFSATPTRNGEAGERLKIFFANVHFPSTKYSEMENAILAKSPDIVALVEMTPAWQKALNLRAAYTFFKEAISANTLGVAVYSKFPLSERWQENVGEDLKTVLIGEVLVPENPLRLVVLHSYPPVSRQDIAAARMYLRRITASERFSGPELIVAGDFNATPFSGFYKSLIKNLSLKDSSWGWGLGSTWPMSFPLSGLGMGSGLKIDHILFRSNTWSVANSEIIRSTGSDHAALFVEFERK